MKCSSMFQHRSPQAHCHCLHTFHKHAHSLLMCLISIQWGVFGPMRQLCPYLLIAIIISNARHTYTCAHPNAHLLCCLSLKPSRASLKKNISLHLSCTFCLCFVHPSVCNFSPFPQHKFFYIATESNILFSVLGCTSMTTWQNKFIVDKAV